jgi:hypothetical protein
MLRLLFTNFVAAGMFVVRMMLLGVMALLQLTVGGAEIRPASKDVAVVN